MDAKLAVIHRSGLKDTGGQDFRPLVVLSVGFPGQWLSASKLYLEGGRKGERREGGTEGRREGERVLEAY